MCSDISVDWFTFSSPLVWLLRLCDSSEKLEVFVGFLGETVVAEAEVLLLMLVIFPVRVVKDEGLAHTFFGIVNSADTGDGWLLLEVVGGIAADGGVLVDGVLFITANSLVAPVG